MMVAAKTLVLTFIDLFSDTSIVQAVKEEHIIKNSKDFEDITRR